MNDAGNRPFDLSSGDLLADRRFAWGEAAAADGDHGAAIDLFTQTLELVPAWAPAWLALAEAHRRLGRITESRDALEQAARLDGSEMFGARLRLAALGAGPAPTSAPPAYVRDLFDQYAPRFDAHLTNALQYRGPEVLREAVARACAARGRAPRFAGMLDLGCGTGLGARAFAADVVWIEGVDLSTGMLAEAAKTGLYRQLVAGDLVAFLGDRDRGGAELVIAADVFVYMGDLAPVFSACVAALAKGGLFAFTTQFLAEGDWIVGDDLRYAHSPACLLGWAEATGFETLLIEQVSTRHDAGEPVPGLVAVMARR